MDNQETMIQTLQRIPWFLELSFSQIEALSKIASIRTLNQGEILFSEGDSEDCLYIILEGQAAVEAHIPGRGLVFLYNADPLDIIGWSVLTPVIRQRTATVRATADIRFLCFNSQILRQMCELDHDFGFIIMRRIANVVSSRLLSTRLQLFEILRQTDNHF